MQEDVPQDSLRYWYAPFDPLDAHGAFATVSVDRQSLTITYYTGKGGRRGRGGASYHCADDSCEYEYLLCQPLIFTDKLLYSTQNNHPRQKTGGVK